MLNNFSPLRTFNRVISSILISFLISASVNAQDIETREVGERMAIISGTGTNILIKQSPNGEVMMIDGGLEENSQQTLDAIGDILDVWGNDSDVQNVTDGIQCLL